MIAFFRFVLVSLLLIVVAMSSALITMHFAIHGTEVAVPDLRAMTVADAGRRAASLGLTVHVENRLYSTDIPIGRVSDQSPLAGAIVRRGWRLWLTESLGPQKLTIPDLIGTDQRIAAINIRRSGMQIGTVAEMPWPDAAPGAVLAQSPEPDASGVESPVMNLLVASQDNPPPADGLVMPNLEGQVFTNAALMLTHLGLRLAPVEEPRTSPTPASPSPTPPVAPGTIVAQNPPAGYRVDPSMPVQLTVAR